MKRILNKTRAFQTDFHGDGRGGFTLHSHADVGPQIEHNKRVYDGDRMARRKSDMRSVAEIPQIIFMKWMNEEHLTAEELADPKVMDKFLRKKLNDSDNAAFRVGPEKL